MSFLSNLFNPYGDAVGSDGLFGYTPKDGGNPAAGGNAADLTKAEKMGKYAQIANKWLSDMFAEKAAIAEQKRRDQYKNADLYAQFQANLPALAQTRQSLGTRSGVAQALAGMY